MSKIKKITVANLKAVSSLTADFNGCTAIITGGNNKGKSSFLKSLPERLRGNKPEMILKQGEKEGFAEWELTTGEKFVWTFDGKKEKLTFISERNIPQSVTKDLSRVYFPPVFDVDEFLQAAPAKQKKTLQELTGIDFSEFDKIYKEAYEARTYANKRRDEEKVKLGYIDPKLSTEPEFTEDLEKELSGIATHNMKYEQVEKGVAERQKQIEDIDADIVELEAKIKALNEKKIPIQEDIQKGKAWMEIPEHQTKNNSEELRAKIEVIKKANDLIIENNKLIEQQKTYDRAVENAKLADEEVKRIEAEKLDVIKNSTLPEGFGFSDEGITYNSFAFNKETLSSSKLYIAALKLAAVGLGEVKTLHFDASFLDKNSLLEIEAWATENDLQLLIERPDFDGGEIEYQILQAD
jgi:hypothetical protein